MRLFKRQSSDTSPQLVSATPLSQDGAAHLTIVDDNSDRTRRKGQEENDGSERTSIKEVASDPQQPSSSQTCISNRKGISTWGRKVGRRWDQLKRSDSSELLSVSGRRRRWSPNRKSCGNVTDEKENGVSGSSSELPKPKRISRVESLRNLFRSSERNNNFLGNDVSTRSVTIQEENITCISHYPMEKALSEGALKNTPFRLSSDDSQLDRGTILHEKKRQLSRSIHDLQEQQRILDYILKNQDILKTQEGSTFAKETLDKTRRSASPKRTSQSMSDGNKNSVSTQTKEFLNTQLNNIKRNLFNVRTTASSECDRTDASKPCQPTGLEDLMNNLRLGCDESGYDSDSTRAGADSPDSGKSVPPMLKPRSFSITSEDYHGIDLSLQINTLNNGEAAAGTDEIGTGPLCLNETVVLEKSLLNESVRTDITALNSDGDDTDSCDEDTFEGFTEFQMSCAMQYSKFDNTLVKCNTSLSNTPIAHPPSTSNNLGELRTSTSESNGLSRIPETRTFHKSEQSMSCSQAVKIQHPQKETKSHIPLKSGKHRCSSKLTLLDNAASPCKDSPPASKICATVVTSPLQYYSPKRSRSNIEPDDVATVRNKAKRPAHLAKVEQTAPLPPTPAKTLIRRELKTMKLYIEKSGSLGISVERREAVRPFYVISKLYTNGEAAKSMQFKIGDEIVRVCGRRLRGMSIVEARNALRACVGTVELQIAREPTFTFGDELGDTWGDMLVRTRSDSEVWTLKGEKIDRETAVSVDTVTQPEDSSKCAIIGALSKDGNSLSTNAMERIESNYELRRESDQKMTGMRKFQVVRKRSTNPVSCPRRATSLSMDLLSITLEKGAAKKLGFSIVGGSDSNKGSMGIFVKDIMAGGQAAEEGTLKVADEILAINGISMDGLTHAKALQTFKAAKAGKMILHVGRRDPTHKRLCYRR